MRWANVNFGFAVANQTLTNQTYYYCYLHSGFEFIQDPAKDKCAKGKERERERKRKKRERLVGKSQMKLNQCEHIK